MKISQLPQHVLSDIVSYAVSDTVTHNALRLRLVNKQFNTEVLHTCFQKHLDEFLSRPINIPPTGVIGYRCFRGFLLSADSAQAGKLTPLRYEMLRAASKLTSLLTEDSSIHLTGGQFLSLYPSRSGEQPSQDVVAFLGEAIISFLGDVDALCRVLVAQRYQRFPKLNEDEPLHDADDNATPTVEQPTVQVDAMELDNNTNLPNNQDHVGNEVQAMGDNDSIEDIIINSQLKLALECNNIDFWLMIIAAHFGSKELLEKSLSTLRREDTAKLPKMLRNTLRIAIKQGHQEMVLFLLDQPEVIFSEVKQDGRDKETILDTAIRSGHTTIVKELMRRGWNIHYSSGDLAAYLMVAIIHNPDASSRAELVSHFLSLTNEWRSDAFTSGLLQQLFTKGDLVLTQLVTEKIKSDTSDHSGLLWRWNLPDRYYNEDDRWTPSDDPPFEAVCSHGPEFIKFFFTNLQDMPKFIRDSINPIFFVEEIERSIDKNKLSTFKELFKHATAQKLVKNKALAYAAARGNPSFLTLLVEDFDLNVKIPDYGMYWLERDVGSNLRYVLGDLELAKTPFLFDSNLMTIGSFCLGVSIKALKPDNVKFFLSRGIRLGARLSYITGNFHGTRNTCLLVPPDADIGSWAVGVTCRFVTLMTAKCLLEGGIYFDRNGVFLSRGKDGGRLKLRGTKHLEDWNARAISGIEISHNVYELDAFDEMENLLTKHHMPWIYLGEYTRCYESSLIGVFPN